MRFDGRLYFDFSCPDVWRFYRFLVAAVADGAVLGLDWEPYIRRDDNRTSLLAHVAIRRTHPEKSGAFVQAMLMAVHERNEPHDSFETIKGAAVAAGIDAEWLAEAMAAADAADALDAGQTEAVELGVTGTPTLYRNGPVLYVEVSGAAPTGDVLDRLRLLDRVLTDDGLWVLRKP
ncbi:MAG: hypothetical protein HKN07_00910 [Acidimicrobiia bacterium]|nr:hypothetical protein [Acidimicrobiia bacterium]